MEAFIIALLIISAIVGKGFFEWGTNKIPSFDSKSASLSVAILWLLSWVVGGGFFISFLWFLEWINF